MNALSGLKITEKSLLKFFSNHNKAFFLGIVIITIFLRFFLLTSVPAGINQDEADVGYESYSLLHNGTDKWGNKWPIYFISWGSGQNALASYLDMPIIDINGLNTLSVRLIPAICGVMSVVLLYAILRLFSIKLALLASGMLAIFPWAIMSSRLALDSNILPFFIIAGIASFLYSYRSRHRRYLIPLSLIPFGLAFYAYIVSIVVIPFLLLGLFILYKKEILENKIPFVISLCILVLLSTPIIIFLSENYIFHRVLHVFSSLPFSAPVLLQSRLSQNDSVSFGAFLWTNLHFLTSGFNDNLIWSNMAGYVTSFIYLPLAFFASIFVFLKSKDRVIKVLALWFWASFTLLILTPLDDVRANSFMIPLVAMSAVALVTFYKNIRDKTVRMLSLIVIGVLILVNSLSFTIDYYTNYNEADKTGYTYFNSGFSSALTKAQKLAGNKENIFVTNSVNLNYVYTLFYLKVSPKDFQSHTHYYPLSTSYGIIYKVENYRNYYFDQFNPVLQSKSYVYVLKDQDGLTCNPMHTIYDKSGWRVGTCYL